MTNMATIRESALSNGMRVGPKGVRLVSYQVLPDGTWAGTWFAQERSLKAARERLVRAVASGECAELWRDGQPLEK